MLDSVTEQSFGPVKKTSLFKASRLNDLKSQINSYFQDLGQGQIFDDIGTAPLKFMLNLDSHRKKEKTKPSPPPPRLTHTVHQRSKSNIIKT